MSTSGSARNPMALTVSAVLTRLRRNVSRRVPQQNAQGISGERCAWPQVSDSGFGRRGEERGLLPPRRAQRRRSFRGWKCFVLQPSIDCQIEGGVRRQGKSRFLISLTLVVKQYFPNSKYTGRGGVPCVPISCSLIAGQKFILSLLRIFDNLFFQ